MQIMVAEHDYRASAKRTHEAQDVERSRPAVDEVADKPEAVGGAEPDLLQQRSQLIEAAPHVADPEGGHPSQKLASSRPYLMAPTPGSEAIELAPARSATVRATRSTR